MRTKPITPLLLLVMLGTTSCHELFDLLDEFKPEEAKVIDYASGLSAPFGLEVDDKGNVWVAEAGTGNNDGRISVITSRNKVYPVIEGFTSVFPPNEPTALGVYHMLLDDHNLWAVNGIDGRLYHADLSSFKPGDMPLQASELESEDIATFVLNYDFGTEDTGESNPYNLTMGPDGDIYITDAAANAIIRREAGTGTLSVFTVFPDIDNPTEIGPPTIDAVPTGIVFDGYRFLVSTLTGFPFLENEALIYQVDLYGNVSICQEGFTSLTDITLSPDKKPVVLQYAVFGQGFAPMTGKIIKAEGQEKEVLLEEINYPLGIARRGIRTYYVTNSVDGIVQKVTY
ncbi:ScyD/ScyE family protein [Catalinimonas niigatensis]|uniref:ScyD/ScyE family protein n=1 Tax=Catalinimonas niigatensis TaxID=1397264 RepID=UPI0026651D15|nr:ScyD/ScyE family protein [Catalinimonas niigatensis]WPP50469.1 ScyD/ScyE family protein [Catalinimonas niigatensis]